MTSKAIYPIRLFIFCFLFSLSANGKQSLYAQILPADSAVVKRHTFFPAPIIYFSPETNWGFGVAGLLTFRPKNVSMEASPSQLALGGAYTLNKQLLSYLNYQLFFKEDLFKLYGELGYYRYNYFFYGIGNENTNPDGELFDVNYPRIRINALKQVRPNLFLGLRYWMEDYLVKKVEPDGRLDNNDITGSGGNFLSGLGVVANYDTRDKIFFPSKGLYIESVLFANGKFLGSPFNFQKFYLDASTYIPTKWNQILALNFYSEFTAGETPFNQLALMGGNKKMRGYYEGRFRDNHIMVLQAEYRIPIWWRIGINLFGSYGSVANNFSEFGDGYWRFVGGGGLRININKKETVNLRIDAGFGKNTSGYYFTVGEAF